MKTASVEQRWEKTRSQYLVRRKASGRCYARLYRDGKALWKSLKTAHPSVAEARLVTALNEHRQSAGRQIDASNAQHDFIHFQAAQASGSPKRAQRLAGGFRSSLCSSDRQKALCRQRQRRTCLTRPGGPWLPGRPFPWSGGARTSRRSARASSPRSVESSAGGSKRPLGGRTSTQRSATGGAACPGGTTPPRPWPTRGSDSCRRARPDAAALPAEYARGNCDLNITLCRISVSCLLGGEDAMI